MIELADALRALDGVAPVRARARPGAPRRGRSAAPSIPSLAREVLGWEARVGLAEGLERTLASIRA